MFGLFKSASPGVEVIDKVWMTKQAKLSACSEMLQLNPGCVFIAWFEDTLEELQTSLNLKEAGTHLILAQNVTSDQLVDRMPVFVEHYPSSQIEQSLFSRLNLQEVPVLSSLDEPFFQKFGGVGIIDSMKKLGMRDDEVIGHSFVTKSIRNAQDSIAKTTRSDYKAKSQQEWFSLNVK